MKSDRESVFEVPEEPLERRIVRAKALLATALAIGPRGESMALVDAAIRALEGEITSTPGS